MPDMWMDVDVALAEVPVNLMPLIDDTDFKTIEDAVAYNAPGMDLRWNFVTTDGSYTSTAVTPTTAGTYDWTHQGDAMYTIEIPASAGASINNDTEGFGWFSGKMTGVLPFRGPVIGFRAVGLNNLLIDSAFSATVGLSGSNLDAAISGRMATYTQPTGFLAATFPGTVASPTNITAASGVALSSAGIQAIWDALTAALTTVNSIGKLLVDNINATISSRASQTSLDTLDDYVDSEVAAIKAKTDLIPAGGFPANFSSMVINASGRVDLGTWLGVAPNALQTGRVDSYVGAMAADVVDATALASTAVNEIADGLLDRADAIETGYSVRGILRINSAAMAGILSGAATTTVVIKNVTNTKTRITATVDADGNRSALTLDAT